MAQLGPSMTAQTHYPFQLATGASLSLQPSIQYSFPISVGVGLEGSASIPMIPVCTPLQAQISGVLSNS